jgi:GR25 family glycosyltransferase involved in LPS biosynthesis
MWRLSLFIIAISAWADLEDHLKKAPNKSTTYSMPGIDLIYIMNLDQRPEKLKSSLDQLSSFQIYPYRFSAVNGWELSLNTLNDVGLKYSPEMEGGILGTCYPLDGNFEPSHEIIQNYGQSYFCHCMARGTVGICLSHISILQDAFDSGYETIWVMEDDIEVLRDPRDIPNLITKLDQLVGDEHWDILFTDRDMRDAYGNYTTTCFAGKRPDFLKFSSNDFAKKTLVSADFYEIGARSGATSMIIRRSGIKKLLQYFKAHQIFFPYDMEYVFPRGIKLYTVVEDIVSNIPKAPSDNGSPNYLNKE